MIRRQPMSVRCTRDDGAGKLDRHALRDGAAAITARDHELPVAENLGHQPMHQPRDVLYDARDLVERLHQPGESEARQ